MCQERIEIIQWLRIGYELGKCWELFVDDFLPGDALIRVHVLSRLQVALESLDTQSPVLTGAIRDLRLAMAAWETADQVEITPYQTVQHLRGVHAHLAGYSIGTAANSAFEFGFELGRSFLRVESETTIEPEQSTTASTPSSLFPPTLSEVSRRFWQFRDFERLQRYSQRIERSLPERLCGLAPNELLPDEIPDITSWAGVYPYHRLGWHYADIQLSNLENPPPSVTNAPQRLIEASRESTPANPAQAGPTQNAPTQPIPIGTRRVENLQLTITDEGTVTRDIPGGSPRVCRFDTQNQPWRLFNVFLTEPNYAIALTELVRIWGTRDLGASLPRNGTVRQAISALNNLISVLDLEIVTARGRCTLQSR